VPVLQMQKAQRAIKYHMGMTISKKSIQYVYVKPLSGVGK